MYLTIHTVCLIVYHAEAVADQREKQPDATHSCYREAWPGSGRPAARPYVYVTCMARVRTNIEIEDQYVQAIMRRYGLRTKTEVVDLALRKLAAEPMTREEALAMRGTGWEGDLNELRAGYRGSSAA